jgi:hypothetical protein
MPGKRPARIYPKDANGFVRQCAWCRRVADGAGRYRLAATVLIATASHGCCRGCAVRFLNNSRRPRRATQARLAA